MDLVARLEEPARSRALVCRNINIADSNPEQARLRRALAREDLFTVVIDLFATDTADLPDIVPSGDELFGVRRPRRLLLHHSLSAQVQAGAAEALPNSEIFRRLAVALGYDDPPLHEADREVIDELLRRANLRLDFDALAARGTVWIGDEPHLQLADGRFPTPSARIEIASAQAEADGHPRLPEQYADPRPQPGRLRLLTPASPWLLNDNFANDPKIARRLGTATVALHPLDAADRGLAEYDHVVLSSETGTIELSVTVSEELPRYVAYSPKGRWPKAAPQGANVNALNSETPSDLGASTSVHGLEVTVRRTAAPPSEACRP